MHVLQAFRSNIACKSCKYLNHISHAIFANIGSKYCTQGLQKFELYVACKLYELLILCFYRYRSSEKQSVRGSKWMLKAGSYESEWMIISCVPLTLTAAECAANSHCGGIISSNPEMVEVGILHG